MCWASSGTAPWPIFYTYSIRKYWIYLHVILNYLILKTYTKNFFIIVLGRRLPHYELFNMFNQITKCNIMFAWLKLSLFAQKLNVQVQKTVPATNLCTSESQQVVFSCKPILFPPFHSVTNAIINAKRNNEFTLLTPCSDVDWTGFDEPLLWGD